MKLLFLLLNLCFISFSTLNARELEKPNILLILADDMGYGDVNIYFPENKHLVKTTHIDALALSGMRFLDAHSGAAVCSPSRFGILTGRNYSREPF